MNKDIKLTWNQLRDLFMAWNKISSVQGAPGLKEPLHAVVVFKESNWPDVQYSLEARSYHITSDNKAFRESLSCAYYGEALDGSDPRVALHRYDWEIDYCYLY